MDDLIVTENLQNGSGTIDRQEIMFNSYLMAKCMPFVQKKIQVMKSYKVNNHFVAFSRSAILF